jgi:DNA-binding NarL/FixJ family response regulator
MSIAPATPLKLVLIDDDAVFRLGLKIWLNQFADLAVVADADGAAALQSLVPNHDRSVGQSVDLVILALMGTASAGETQGLTLCQQITAQFPDLPVLMLSDRPEPVLQAAAQQAGAIGYCPKALEVGALVQVIRQAAAGQSCWLAVEPPSPAAISAASDADAAAALTSPLTVLRRNLRSAGIQRIEAALAAVTAQFQNPDLSALDRAVLAGRRRELRASRWLVNRLLAIPAAEPAVQSSSPSAAPSLIGSVEPASIAVVERPVVDARTLQSVLVDRVLAKLQTSLHNQTNLPLEIDILREDKKRELFYLVLRKLEELLDELRFSQVEPAQLSEKRSAIEQDLWQAVVSEFYGRYYTVRIGNLDLEVVAVLLQAAEVVQAAILDKIPFVEELLAHLLFQTPLVVNGTPQTAGSPEALQRGEILLENLLIQVANAVVQPLLNRFPDVEVIKHHFYDFRLMSSREIERFRNSLSWKYRVEQAVNEPKAIFESQYRLLIFYGRGIQRISIYAPRTIELEQLSGVPLIVTLALETRDAVAPRLRSLVAFVGSGVIYVLTEVIGRGIGLIGRGILKGIGGAWQDSRFDRRDSSK